MSRRAMVGMVMIAGLAAAGCGGDGGGGGELGSGDDYSVTGALGELPAELGDESGLYVTAGDLTLASEAAGVERPDGLDDTEAVAHWIGPLTGGPIPGDPEAAPTTFVPVGEVFNTSQLVRVAEFQDELGWSLLDVDSFVEFSLPPSRFSVVSGEFEDDTLSDDLIDMGDGLVTTMEGDDHAPNLDEQRPSDVLGRPVRLAQDGDRIMSSLGTPLAEAWVEGPDETLADDEDLSEIAGALDDADVFSAMITRPEDGFGGPLGERGTEADQEQVLAEIEESIGSLPAPFHTVGVGWTVDDEGPVITVVYQHDSEEVADDNVENLETVFTDGESLVAARSLSETYELEAIEADGTLVVATLRPGPEGRPDNIYQAIHSRDTPVVHG